MFLATHGVLSRSGIVLPNFSTQSFNLDGTSDYIDCGNPTELQITGELSLSAWYRLDATGFNVICMMSKDNVSQRAFSFWASVSTNAPSFSVWSGSTYYSAPATTNTRDGQWHHIVGVFTPSVSVKIYVDGVLEGTNTTSIPSSINNANTNFKIGTFGTGSRKLNGSIDETSVFNYALSSANVSTIYGSGIPTDISTLTPVAHWRAETSTWGGSNWTVTDEGSGGNNGTSVSMGYSSRTTDVPT